VWAQCLLKGVCVGSDLGSAVEEKVMANPRGGDIGYGSAYVNKYM